MEKGHAIVDKRLEIVERINSLLPDVFARVSGRGESLRWLYRPSLAGSEEDWRAGLERIAAREQAAGYALVGPHRDDFRFEMGGKRSDDEFSQGEYRISVLGLILAMNGVLWESRQVAPVLILDDLYSELDPLVRGELMGYLAELRNQIFVTTTQDAPGLYPQGAHVREIRGGKIA